MFTYRKLLMALIASAAVPLAVHAQDLTPNSQFFSVQNYYYPDANGDYRPYRAFGFAEQSVPTSPRLLVLPTLSVGSSDVQFFETSGQEFDPQVDPDREAASVSMKVRYSTALPVEAQMPGIAAALLGRNYSFFIAPPITDTNGNPLMTPHAQGYPPVSSAIHSAYADYARALVPQQELIAHYRTFQAQAVPMSELKLSLMIDGTEVASRTLSGSTLISGSSLPPVTLVAPTAYQVNKIKGGSFDLSLAYRFRDSNVASVEADFDRSTLVRSFLEETQSAITKQKSSGWQVFHIGSRRSKISQSINANVESSYIGRHIDRTRVVMRDASDAMIRLFEDKFFPEISRQNVISGHLSAAAIAEADGRPELARAHSEYAAALANNNELAEVDAVGAAAALNAGDYATFVAKGVRASSSNNIKANSFRRVVSEELEQTRVTGWRDTRIVSAQREVTVPVQLEDSAEQMPRWGLCNAVWGPLPASVPNPYGPPVQLSGMMPTCVNAGSPFAAAGLIPGSLVLSFNGRRVRSQGEFETAIERLKPGDIADIRYFDLNTNSEQSVRVKSKLGSPIGS